MAKSHDGSQLRSLRHEPGRVAPRRELTLSKDRKAKVIVRATYWKPWEDLDITEWIILGRRLGSIGRGVAWWIGDWVNYGNAQFGQKYSRAATITGYDVQSLMNMSYVASRFDYSRRRETLSWSHHAELAGLAMDYQDMWLDDAERKRLSVRGLREALRTWRASQVRAAGDTEPQASAGHGRDDRGAGPGHSDVVCPQCGYRMGVAGD